MNKNKKLRLLKSFKELADNPDFFAKDGEEFEGHKHCIIWTGAENWVFKETISGTECEYPLADYYEKPEGYKKFTDWLSKNNLCFEWHDAGTIMIYEEMN